MNKEKTIVFLGGCFQAEFSMRASLIANDVKVYYLYTEDTPEYLLKDLTVSNYNMDIITFVAEENLKEFLKLTNPNCVIHRFYRNDAVMHYNAYNVCKNLNIPYGKYLMETDVCDTEFMCERFQNCDFILYAHDTENIKNAANRSRKKCYFYPYGVGVNEYSVKESRFSDVVGFGYTRFGIAETNSREENLKMFIEGLKKINLKLNVFYCPCETNKWENTIFNENVFINNFFTLECENETMNRFKIAINFESVSKIEGAYSHKMFQTAGRGIPTLTFRKKCLENMFGFSGENLIFVESSDEVAYWIDFLLKNEKYREEIGDRCERFTHYNFDWYKRFNLIMLDLGLWKY